jgi:putative copper export protein
LPFASLPWIFANLGFYVGDVPGLRSLFTSKQIVPEAGHPHLRAVHLGNHEGIDGVLLVVTAVVLIRTLSQIANRARRTALSAYLSLLLVYGLVVALADGWHEQVVKRGWTTTKIPNVLHPAASAAWLGVLVAALALWLTQRQIVESADIASHR